MKKKHHKMDRFLVSKQKWELEWVTIRMWRKEKISCSMADVLLAIIKVGRSRRKVYQLLRSKKLLNDIRSLSGEYIKNAQEKYGSKAYADYLNLIQNKQ